MTWQEVAGLVAVLAGIGAFWWWLTEIAIASALRAKEVQSEFEKRDLKTKLDFLRIEKYLTEKLAIQQQRISHLERSLAELHDYDEG